HTGAPSTATCRRRVSRSSTAPPSDRRLRLDADMDAMEESAMPSTPSFTAASSSVLRRTSCCTGAAIQLSRFRAACRGSWVPRVSHQLAVRSSAASTACVTTVLDSTDSEPGAKAAAMVACIITS
ncbi:hypothetical protein Vretimale_4582, partial [Volvox reticuliferus]